MTQSNYKKEFKLTENEKEIEARRKALEIFLSGKQRSGRGTEEETKELSEEDKKMLEGLTAPTSTKDLKVRGRKKGIITPRQTFRVDEVLWRQFKAACRRKAGKSASEVLREFIYRYTHG